MIAPRFTNLRIERHDIVRNELPTAHFHLIHARLVLIHIPERDAVLRADLARLDDADFAVPSPIMWSVRGRRAAFDPASA